MTDVKINLSQPLLNNLLHQSGASALIVLSGDKAVGTAGALLDSAVQTLVSILLQNWPVSIARDLTRYVGLSIVNDDHFLSAKFLPESDLLLGLVFPLQTSLCRIRQDLTSIMGELLKVEPTKHEPQGRLEQSLQILFNDYPAPDPTHLSGPAPSVEQIKDEKMTEDINGAASPEDQAFWEDTHPTIIESKPRSLTYGKPVMADETNQGEEGAAEFDLAMEDIPWQPLEGLMPSDEEITAAQSDDAPLGEERHATETQKSAWQTLEEQEQEEHDLVSILQEDFTSVQDLTPADVIVLPLEDLPDPVGVDLPESEDEIEASFLGEAEAVEWQPVAADITFYLVPRLKRHFLVKELPHDLRRWIPQICETYGWQLDALSVRPDYLKWTLRDFPESLIRKMLRIIRRETSQRIFEAFPNLQHGNPTEDFWSQSYLVDRENLEISTQALIAHVAKERLTSKKTT